MKLKDWRWNRETRRWELVETGEEYTLVDVVRDAPGTGVFSVGALIVLVVMRLVRAVSRVSKRKRRLSRQPSEPPNQRPRTGYR
jgi:hypothetical protein